MKDSSFNIRWGSVVIGFLLGIFGLIFFLFSKSDRRDKIYSSLLGCAIGMVINFFIFRYAGSLPN